MALPQSAGPSSIDSNKENVLQVCPQANVMEETPQLRCLLPRCVKLTADIWALGGWGEGGETGGELTKLSGGEDKKVSVLVLWGKDAQVRRGRPLQGKQTQYPWI